MSTAAMPLDVAAGLSAIDDPMADVPSPMPANEATLRPMSAEEARTAALAFIARHRPAAHPSEPDPVSAVCDDTPHAPQCATVEPYFAAPYDAPPPVMGYRHRIPEPAPTWDVSIAVERVALLAACAGLLAAPPTRATATRRMPGYGGRLAPVRVAVALPEVPALDGAEAWPELRDAGEQAGGRTGEAWEIEADGATWEKSTAPRK